MKLINPIAVTDSMVTYNSITEPSSRETSLSGWQGEYASGTAYAANDRVVVTGTGGGAATATHKIYISQQGSNTGNDPTTDDGTWWVEEESTDAWKAFDNVVQDQAVDAGFFTFYLEPDQFVNSAALVNADAEVAYLALFKDRASIQRNVLTWTAAFNNAAWLKYACTVTANTTETQAPDGTYTAEKIEATGATAQVYRNTGTMTVSGGLGTFSFYLKKGSASFVRILSNNYVAGSFQLYVDLENGVGTLAKAGYFTFVRAYSIEPIHDDWFRVSIQSPLTHPTPIIYVGIKNNIAEDGTITDSISGDSIYIWGAQVERTEGTEVGDHDEINHVQESEDIPLGVNNLQWVLYDYSAVLSSDSYSGSLFNDFTETTASTRRSAVSLHYTFGSMIHEDDYNFSAVVKKKGRRYVILGYLYNSSHGGLVQFDLDTGTVVYSADSGDVSYVADSATITELESGVFRVSCAFNLTTLMLAGGAFCMLATDSVSVSTHWYNAGDPALYFAGDVNKGVYATQFQASRGADLKPYQYCRGGAVITGGVSTLTNYEEVGSGAPSQTMEYLKKIDLQSIDGISDWYSYFFNAVERYSYESVFNIPPYSGDYTIRFTTSVGSGNAELGKLVLGQYAEIGTSLHGSGWSIDDYSVKTVDTNGRATITSGSFSKRATTDVYVATANFGKTYKTLQEIRSTPCAWIPDENNQESIVFGYYRNFDIVINDTVNSQCMLEIEGLI